MNSFPYSQEYTPAAPVIPVRLAVMEEGRSIGPYTALADTGADGTFVPTRLLEELGTVPIYSTTVRSYLGEKVHRAEIHLVDLILFGNVRLPGIEVVSDDWGEGQIVVGRNVLNKLTIHLNGPNQEIRVNE